MKFTHLEQTVINRFGLQSTLDWRNTNNTSVLPYHNNQHMDFVLKDCIEFYLWSLLHTVSCNDHYVKALFLAAIFHDINYKGSGFGRSDSINILEAKYSTIKYLSMIYESESEEKNLRHVVLSLIDATEYPYTVVNGLDELKFYHGVLRDADRMTILHGKTGRKMVASGLYEEIQLTTNHFEYEDYKAKEEDFLYSIKWNTHWAKSKQPEFNAAIERTIKKMNDNLNDY